MYNIYKFVPELERSQPDIVLQHREEIERFQRHIADSVCVKLLTLFAIIPELPEDALAGGHNYQDHL